MDTLQFIVSLWVICAPFGYLVFRSNMRKRSRVPAWDNSDRLFGIGMSLFLGPLMFLIFIPWKFLILSFCEWLDSPARW
jgi:hypothetical protein